MCHTVVDVFGEYVRCICMNVFMYVCVCMNVFMYVCVCMYVVCVFVE